MIEVKRVATDCQTMKIPDNEIHHEGGFAYIKIDNYDAVGVAALLTCDIEEQERLEMPYDAMCDGVFNTVGGSNEM